jgi:hypothetical protein
MSNGRMMVMNEPPIPGFTIRSGKTAGERTPIEKRSTPSLQADVLRYERVPDDDYIRKVRAELERRED